MEVFGHEFKSKAMYNIIEDIIKPKYSEIGISYALAKKPKGLKTEVFVPYTWGEPFDKFIDSIEAVFDSSYEKPHIWICASLVQGASDK